MSTAVVTGANGFIGSHLVTRLLERGDEVIALVRRTSDLRRLAPLARTAPDRLRLVVGGLTGPEPASRGSAAPHPIPDNRCMTGTATGDM